MDIWHKLNPFHTNSIPTSDPPRAPSVLRRTPHPSSSPHPYSNSYQQPGPNNDHIEPSRPSSSLESTLPGIGTNEDGRNNCRPYTPTRLPGHKPEPEQQRRRDGEPQREKTHRTPSILRTLAHHPSLSALKNKSRKKGLGLGKNKGKRPVWDGGFDLGNGLTSGKKGLTVGKRGSLKGSKSVPRDLRLGFGSPGKPLSIDLDDEFNPPLPTPTIPHRDQRRYNFSTSPSRRILPPRTPEIVVRHHDEITPERVKMRMDIAVEFGMEGRPRPLSGSPAQVLGGVEMTRHLSTAIPPFQQSFNPSGPTPPKTFQHPHPVPLVSSRETSYYATPHSSNSVGEFEPKDDDYVGDIHDGLEMMVRQEDMPIGTPGGKKEDLRRGAFVDGVKHEHGAIRFFSRDMYAPLSTNPTPNSSLGPEHAMLPPPSPLTRSQSSPPSLKTAAIRSRSESPFEVKLSPNVTKHMSLDAFGTPSPPDWDENEHVEELVDETPAKKELEYEWDSPEVVSDINLPQRVHTLSTIDEGSSKLSESPLEDRVFTSTPASKADRTKFYTPSSDMSVMGLPLSLPRSGIPHPDFDSYELSRRGLSSPPTHFTQALLDAHREHVQGHRGQVSKAEFTIEDLKKDNKRLKEEFQVEEEEKKNMVGRAIQRQRIIVRLQDEQLIAAKELAGVKEDAEQSAGEHAHALSQAQAALSENEEFFDQLREAHDRLAQQCTALQAERDELIFARQADANTLVSCQDTIKSLEAELKTSIGAQVIGPSSDVEVQNLKQRLMEVEAQLETTTDEYTSHITDHDEAMTTSRRQAKDKDTTIHRLESQLKVTSETAEDYINTLKLELEDVSSKYAASGKTLDADLHNALRQLNAKDAIITVLREKVATSKFEGDERVVQAQTELGMMKRDVEGKEAELKGMRVKVVELEDAMVRVSIAESAGEERDREMKEVLEEVAKIESDRLGWYQERAELLERLDRVNEENDPDLNERINDLLTAEATLTHEVTNLRDDLVDAQTSLNVKTTTIQSQVREIAELRIAAADAEEAIVQAQEDSDRQKIQFQRITRRTEVHSQDLQIQLDGHSAALASAVLDAEKHNAESADVRSRLEAYLCEIDRLKLSDASFRSEIDTLRRQSADENLKSSEMRKKLDRLEEDKELLNVALESKQHELILLQRQLGRGSGSVTPRTKERMATLTASTGRVPYTPSSSSSGTADVTPIPNRRLAASTSSSSNHLRASHIRRESSITSTPRPLASSTAYNRTPKKKKVISKPAVPKQVMGGGQSSVPVLMKRSGSFAPGSKVGQVSEEVVG